MPPEERRTEKEGKLINTSSGWSFVSSGGKMGKFMHFPPLPCHNKIFEIIGAPHSCAMIPPLKVTLVNKTFNAYFERDASDVRAELEDLGLGCHSILPRRLWLDALRSVRDYRVGREGGRNRGGK